MCPCAALSIRVSMYVIGLATFSTSFTGTAEWSTVSTSLPCYNMMCIGTNIKQTWQFHWPAKCHALFSQLRKYARRIIVVNCFAYSCLVFVCLFMSVLCLVLAAPFQSPPFVEVLNYTNSRLPNWNASAFTLKENWTKFTHTEPINWKLFYSIASELLNQKSKQNCCLGSAKWCSCCPIVERFRTT